MDLFYAAILAVLYTLGNLVTWKLLEAFHKAIS